MPYRFRNLNNKGGNKRFSASGIQRQAWHEPLVPLRLCSGRYFRPFSRTRARSRPSTSCSWRSITVTRPWPPAAGTSSTRARSGTRSRWCARCGRAACGRTSGRDRNRTRSEPLTSETRRGRLGRQRFSSVLESLQTQLSPYAYP